MAIIRIHTGSDGKSHFQEIVPKFDSRGDKSETAELIAGSGIIVRRFEPTRSNPWHHAPGRYAVFTLSGAVDIEIGDGTGRRLRVHRETGGLAARLRATETTRDFRTRAFYTRSRISELPRAAGPLARWLCFPKSCVTDRVNGIAP